MWRCQCYGFGLHVKNHCAESSLRFLPAERLIHNAPGHECPRVGSVTRRQTKLILRGQAGCKVTAAARTTATWKVQVQPKGAPMTRCQLVAQEGVWAQGCRLVVTTVVKPALAATKAEHTAYYLLCTRQVCPEL